MGEQYLVLLLKQAFVVVYTVKNVQKVSHQITISNRPSVHTQEKKKFFTREQLLVDTTSTRTASG